MESSERPKFTNEEFDAVLNYLGNNLYLQDVCPSVCLINILS